MAGDSPSGEGGDAPAKRQRINANDCAQLHDFFVSKDWALNTLSRFVRQVIHTPSQIDHTHYIVQRPTGFRAVDVLSRAFVNVIPLQWQSQKQLLPHFAKATT